MNNSYSIDGQNTMDQNTPSLRITKFMCIPTGDYKTPYQRAYNLNPDPQSLDTLNAIVHSNPNGKVTQTDIASALTDMVSLDFSSATAAAIANGWGTKRLAFFMEVEVPKHNFTEVVYLQGYSEYYDPSLTGKIDPNMLFYINSVLIVSKVYDPTTNSINVLPRETYNIVRSDDGVMQDIVMGDMDEKVTIRPTDLLSTLSINDTWGNGDTELVNHYGSVDVSKAIPSTRTNNNPVEYYSKIINSTIDATNITGNDNSASMPDILLQAAQLVSEPNLLTNEFIVTLYRLTGNIAPTEFTISTLERIHPINIDIFEQNNEVAINLNPVFASENTEDLFQATIENNLSTIGVQSISGYMTEDFILELAVGVSNIAGVPVVNILHIRSFITGIDLTRYANRIKSKIEHVLLRELTKNNTMLIDAIYHVDLLGDSNVEISVNHGPKIHYRYPMFADSLYSPVTTTKGKRDAMVDEVSTVIDYTF